MLAAEFALTVAPTARRDTGGDPLVDAGRIDRHGSAKARPDQGDTRGIDVRALRQERQRVARIRDLLQADHATFFAAAVAAAAHIESQADVAELFEQFAGLEHALRIHVAAEAVQHDEGGPPLPRREVARHTNRTGDIEAIGLESNALLVH